MSRTSGGDTSVGANGYEIIGQTVTISQPSGWDAVGVDVTVETVTGHAALTFNGPLVDISAGPINFEISGIDDESGTGFAVSFDVFGYGSFITAIEDTNGVIILDDGWNNTPNWGMGLGAQIAGHGFSYDGTFSANGGSVLFEEHVVLGRGHRVGTGVYSLLRDEGLVSSEGQGRPPETILNDDNEEVVPDGDGNFLTENDDGTYSVNTVNVNTGVATTTVIGMDSNRNLVQLSQFRRDDVLDGGYASGGNVWGNHPLDPRTNAIIRDVVEDATAPPPPPPSNNNDDNHSNNNSPNNNNSGGDNSSSSSTSTATANNDGSISTGAESHGGTNGSIGGAGGAQIVGANQPVENHSNVSEGTGIAYRGNDDLDGPEAAGAGTGSGGSSGPPAYDYDIGGAQPIVIDLDGDGVEVSPLGGSAARFDFDNDGYVERTAWVGADDGILVFDEGNDGDVTSAREIAFSEWTNVEGATDLDGLKAEFDSNNDGTLDANDDRWNRFKIWKDSDQDGEVDAGEMSSLASHDIASFDLERKEDTRVEFSDGSILHGLFDVGKTDGTTVLGGDMQFAYQTNGVRETLLNGVTTFDYEGGDSSRFKTFGGSLTNFTLSGNFFGAQGNGLANTINGASQSNDLVLDGGAGDDTINGGRGNDIISGGAGNDRMNAGRGHDTVYVDKNDQMFKRDADGVGYANVSGGQGYDTLILASDRQLTTSNIDFYGFEAVYAGNLDDNITAKDNDVDHQLHGNGGRDTLTGAGGDDLLSGGQGNDHLNGSYGIDLLIGGKGDDYLKGGDDDDVYVFARGDGQDTILDQVIGSHEVEYDYNASIRMGGKRKRTVTESRTGVKTVTGEHDAGIDTLQLGAGITIDDVKIGRHATDMMFKLRSAENEDVMARDQVRVKQWTDTDNRIEFLRFSDGMTLDISQIMHGQNGNAGVDELAGTNVDDFLSGGSGADRLQGRDGDDIVVGGSGNDWLSGGDLTAGGDASGKDTLFGGSGNDKIYARGGDDAAFGGDGRDYISGGAGNDLISGGNGNDHLRGYNDDDVLIGGAGDDRLEGGGGDDTYVYNFGDGKDTILDQYEVTQKFKVAETVRVQRSGKSGTRWVSETRFKTKTRKVERNGGDDTLVLGYGLTLNNLAFDRSGSSLRIGVRESATPNRSMNDLENVVTIEQWTDKDNRIETLVLGDGTRLDTSDITYAKSGYAANNTFNGTNGGDILSGGDGNDRLGGLDGADVVVGGNGNDFLMGNNGDDDIYGGDGNDRLYGGNQHDYLLGGNGNDYLHGGNGNDVLIGGVGNDTLKGARGNDTYIFSRGAGKDTIDESAFVEQEYTITEQVAQTVANFVSVTKYKTVKSGKGTVRKKFTTQVRNGTKRIWVNETRTATRMVAVEGGDDTLQFAGSISISDLLVNKVGNDLVVQLAPQSDGGEVVDQVTIKQWNYHQFRIEAFVFQNGFSLDTERVHYAKTGNDNANTLTAVGGRESWLAGRGGNDNITGSVYSDVLVGGTGQDTLRGGNGDDVYVFELGDGKDTILDSGSVRETVDDLQLLNGEVFGDKIVFGNGISIEHISLARSGDDLKIYVRDPGSNDWEDKSAVADVLTVKNWVNTSNRVESLQFYDGTDLDISRITYAWTGGSANDTLNRSNSGDWSDGGGGNDEIHALAGDDYLFGREGNDKLYGDSGSDVLLGGEGRDTLHGGTGDDFLVGGLGNDVLYGNDDEDILIGGDGNDYLDSGAGDDVVIGGSGNDTYSADSGQDIYRFGYGDGQDTYKGDARANYSEDDIVLLEGQLDKGSVWFKRIDNNLVMQLVGSEDKITFEGWYKANATGGAMDKDIGAFVLGDDMLLAKDVNQLVSAMASFDPNDGTTAYGVKAHEIPSPVQTAVNAAWQTMG